MNPTPVLHTSKPLQGGGTTDYAVDIFHAALKHGRYDCFLVRDAALPAINPPSSLPRRDKALPTLLITVVTSSSV